MVVPPRASRVLLRDRGLPPQASLGNSANGTTGRDLMTASLSGGGEGGARSQEPRDPAGLIRHDPKRAVV